jgi:uncharacterized repeat protein (TIGR02543 family)
MDADKTVTANFVPTYTVTYNGNTNTSGVAPTDANLYEEGVSVMVLANSGSLVKTGYTFNVWNTAANGSGINQAALSTFIMSTANVTLYAQWTINSYTVTFNSQGGSAVNTQTVEHGGKVTEPIDPTKTGHTFGGWYKESGCTNAWDFDSDTVTADVTLFAKWTINTYTVTYDGNGSTGGTVPVDSSSPYEYEATVTVLGNTGILVKTGYTFNVWNTAANGSGTSQAAGSTFIMGTADVTLFAKWTINTYTVTFNSQGGSAVASQTVAHGGTVTKPTDPTKADYGFAGWYKESGCTTAWDFVNDTVTADVTFFAKWTRTYNITFNKNSSGATGTMAKQTIASGSSAKLTANAFIRTGWTFAGWATTSGGAVEYADQASYTMGTANVTLYAKWTHTYNITFNKNSSGATGTMAKQTIASGSSAKLTANAFIRTGWTFAGWATTSGGAVEYADQASYTMGTANVTLYAKWTHT